MTPFDPVKYKEIGRQVYSRTGEEYWRTNLGVSGQLKMLLKNIPPDVAKQIEAQAKAEVEKYRIGAKLRIPSEVVIAWAKKEVD